MMALTMILKSFLVDPMMLSVSAISSNSRLPTITGDDFRIAPGAKKSTRKIQGALPLWARPRKNNNSVSYAFLRSSVHRRRRRGARGQLSPPPNSGKNYFFGQKSCKIRAFC